MQNAKLKFKIQKFKPTMQGFTCRSHGQSLVELVVAVGAFVAIVTSITYLVVDGFSTNRQGEELTRATALMNEGHEAAVSIRNQGWDSLTTGDHGIDDSGGFWVFAGSSNDDIDGKYDRVVSVSSIDAQTKKIITTISWEYLLGQTTEVSGISYLTDWQGTGGATPTPVSCNDYCIGLGYTSGICRVNAGKCNDNGEIHTAGGDTYCSHAEGENVCCCK